MKKYLNYIVLLLMVAVSANVCAQDRPNAKQTKSKPKVSTTNKGSQIKYNKLVKTKDPGDEYSGVRTDNFGQKKPKKKVENDTVDVADDLEVKPPSITDNFFFDENPQDRDMRENAFFNRTNPKDKPGVKERPNTKERPGHPEEDEDENTGLVMGLPNYVYAQQEDPGADSEDDILMAGDSAMVHSMKADISTMSPVDIELVNPAKGQNFAFPTPARAVPTSHFGPRRRRFHYGLDLGLPTGEPIYAAFDGVVRFSKYNNSYGHLVVIRHDNGLETYYAHLSKRHVAPGMRVKAGELIGLCGNTGRSRGSHLHFEIRYKGNAMNPENVMDCSTRELISNTITLTSASFRKVAKRGAENASAGSSTNHSAGNYSGNGRYYKVRTGDTLSRIAKRNGTTISKLCKLNGLKETSVIRPGQTLKLR
ncbi:MAG: peptidoglycan DD-metalloendopeptidase family protein [Bacteroidales bacterium]|nr:peptidoglycan DD-metalloendopeptidase family protein [Bacteroidales bacterium]